VIEFSDKQWALILGGSSGFGLATAKKLASHGMSVCVVHRDRRGAMERIRKDFQEIEAHGHGFLALNLDALSDAGRETTMDALGEALGSTGRVRLVMHSIAFGNLKPLAPVAPDSERDKAIDALAEKLDIAPDQLRATVAETFADGAAALHTLVKPEYSDFQLEDEDFERTIFAMGSSLVSWVRDVHQRGFFADDARVLGMTSEGNTTAWRGYAAVSAAKVTLESVCRAIALEYAPFGIRANTVQAGVTNTPALRVIPGSAQMLAVGSLRNPLGRLTRPEDVADFICLLCTDEAAWINGALLRVDGGECIASQ
jgi:NAD(P)-dependent dehydrogenase (short-subunit alcohol dehydrogenase family)